ncbi:Calcium channel YVC1 like protein [Zalerion maritima]|uniref:Calcium channel YVC1 like protein n=1 Tax=Zalerion maritima TaxID=339359 RepID=A0AAD5RGT3_9PEZI|nr:Calcium channel YVC1 like protein [Zalerion maritima]
MSSTREARQGPDESRDGRSGLNRRRAVLFKSPEASPSQSPGPIETDPLLRWIDPERGTFNTTPPSEPAYSCHTNHHSNLHVYTNIHRIKRDIESVVEDYLSFEQLRDVRINLAVVRPLVDKLYDLDDISIVYCLMVNRARFLERQAKLSNRQNVSYTRATLCELAATRILRRWSEDNPGDEGLLTLSHILVAGFEPFQGAPEEVLKKARRSSWAYTKTLPALEVAILSDSKYFLSSTTCQKVIDGIYVGKIVYTPSSFIDLIPDHYKQKPISLYNPREAPLLNQYRLIVPKNRNILEIIQFCTLLALYLAFMTERDPTRYSNIELCFSIYAFSWVLDQTATILEHGWKVYTQNLWSFLDVTFAAIYLIYGLVRAHGLRVDSPEEPYYAQQALDILAMGAPVLVPRLAFNLLSDNLVFVSLRTMMANFTMLTLLSGWCFAGFLLSMIWLGDGDHANITVGKWMLWIWFGLDGTGITKSVEFHWLLGPILMVTFSFLGNTLFLTILVSMLSNTFATIVSNATAEIRYRKAVLTLEGVKSDAIFAYQPPFNLIAFFFFIPLKFVVGPRWFHKIHVFTVRTINLPLLLIIAFAERRIFWSTLEVSTEMRPKELKWWKKFVDWRITTHRDLDTVFEITPPESISEDIQRDDDMTKHLLRRQFTRQGTSDSTLTSKTSSHSSKGKPMNRRDSMFPQLAEQVRGAISSSEDVGQMGIRMSNLEAQNSRIESMLEQLMESRGDDLEDESLGQPSFNGSVPSHDADRFSDTAENP